MYAMKQGPLVHIISGRQAKRVYTVCGKAITTLQGNARQGWHYSQQVMGTLCKRCPDAR